MMDGYQVLADAIIEQAANDYMATIRILKRCPDRKPAMKVAMECERFFRSKWFSTLTDLDPEWLIEKMRKEAVS